MDWPNRDTLLNEIRNRAEIFLQAVEAELEPLPEAQRKAVINRIWIAMCGVEAEDDTASIPALAEGVKRYMDADRLKVSKDKSEWNTLAADATGVIFCYPPEEPEE